MSFINNLNPGKNPPDEINVVIEVPKLSNIKYEIDETSGALFVDRILFTAMFYPFNYGFIPKTREDDGDPVDVLVLGNEPVMPLSVIKSRPVGILITEDEEGVDSKVIAVPITKIDPEFTETKGIEDVSDGIKDQIKHFFEHYKELEKGKYVKVQGWESKDSARQKIKDGISRYTSQK